MTQERHSTFEQIYKSYYPKLIAFASLFLKNDEVHDVVQDVFVNLLEKSSDHFNESVLNKYLYKVVKNKCIDVIRHQAVKNQYASAAREKLLKIEMSLFFTSQNETEEELLSQELHEQIESAIEALPPKGKEIVKYFFQQQKTAKEISVIMNLSQSTVENHIYTCIKLLRQKLKNY